MEHRGDLSISTIDGFEQPQASPNGAVSFETALTLTGFGKFQWSIVIVAGLVYLAAGFQSGLNSYLMPAAACDLQLSSQEKGLLNALYLVGGISSALFWGILADHIGRKTVLITSLFLDALLTFASSFSQSFEVFVVFRFLNGFTIGAPGSIISTYLSEFIGERHRSKCVSSLAFFYTVSWMLIPLIAWGILPLSIRLEAPNFIFNSWRLFVLLFSFPTTVTGLLLAYCFPESPKFLYSQGRELEALEILRNIYNYNGSQSRGDYPVQKILPNATDGAPCRGSLMLDDGEVNQTNKAISNGKSLNLIIKSVWQQIVLVFKPPILGSTLLASALIFCNMFGYFGLGLWLPELFDRFENHYKVSNVSVSVCELTRLDGGLSSVNLSSPTSSKSSDISCQDSDIDPSVFMNTFITGASCMVGNIISSLSANFIGLRVLTVLTMGVSGVCALIIYFLRSSWENLIVSCFFLSFAGTANAVITAAACDLFPTNIRALAVCVVLLAGRISAVLSNLILGYALDTQCEVPVFLMAGFVLVGAALGFLLPKKTNLPNSIKATTSKIS